MLYRKIVNEEALAHRRAITPKNKTIVILTNTILFLTVD